MTRDDIYDHLAQVYLGKRDKHHQSKKMRKDFNVWLVINIGITLIIFSSAFYGLTAFLARKGNSLEQRVMFSLNNGPIRFEYDFLGDLPQVKTFSLPVPGNDAAKFSKLSFSIRGRDSGRPGVVKIELRNRQNEISSYYIRGVGKDWRDYHIPLEEFREITDFNALTDVRFILEAWNVESPRGVVLIDDVSFSS
jgi:hypothetical protein